MTTNVHNVHVAFRQVLIGAACCVACACVFVIQTPPPPVPKGGVRSPLWLPPYPPAHVPLPLDFVAIVGLVLGVHLIWRGARGLIKTPIK